MHLFFTKGRIAITIFLLLLAVVSIYLGLKQKPTVNIQDRDNKTATSATNVYEIKQLSIGEKTIAVEIADSQSELTKGLSYREVLEADTGMYFELGERRQVSFWMHEMRFPLDIIWIDNGMVVGVEENAPVPTSDNTPTFTSPTAVTNVLEVNSGFVQENNIKVGDRVTLL